MRQNKGFVHRDKVFRGLALQKSVGKEEMKDFRDGAPLHIKFWRSWSEVIMETHFLDDML
jgi:hypothetical protein